MDFIDEVKTRSTRFAKRVEHLRQEEGVTEESTKTSLILPFIQMLGYDIFNPAEVIPEFTADVGTKRGEKVDYALIQDGAPTILIEAKKLDSNLSSNEMSQLLRYFGVTETRVGILTDGLHYKFFSDLDQQNVMDTRPFFEFHMLNFTQQQVRELKRFTRADFDPSLIIGVARELKYTNDIKHAFDQELSKTSDDFVTYVMRRVYTGRQSAAARRMFKELTLTAFNQFIHSKINDRLQIALKDDRGSGPDDNEQEKGEITQQAEG